MAVKKREWPAAAIEMVDTAKLKPYAQNAKAHPPEQIAQLGKSYDEFGWTSPILVDEKGEIIAGHGRVMMAAAKGLPQVPTMTARGWTAAQKRAYRLFDNRSAELSQWDKGILRAELVSLNTPKSQALQFTGFTKLDIDAIISPPAPAAGKGSRTPGTVIQTTIIFDSPEQQQTWFNFVRRLKAQYQQQVTFAAKLDEFLKEQLGDAKG